MAYAAFADAPVDVAVVEVGHGRHLGRAPTSPTRRSPWSPRSPSTTPTGSAAPSSEIAGREGGDPQARVVRRARPAAGRGGRGAAPPVGRGGRHRRPRGPGVRRHARTVAVGGQLLTLRGLGGEYDDVFLPLHGAHQAHNAAVRAGRGRGLPRRRPPASAAALDVDIVRAGVRRRHLARTARGRPQLPDRRPGRRAQPGGRAGHRRRAGGVLRVHPAGRRGRRDGRQGRPRHARGVRAGARRGRGHRSRVGPRDAGRRAGGRRGRGLRRRTGSR